jgi:hypothetical protein
MTSTQKQIRELVRAGNLVVSRFKAQFDEAHHARGQPGNPGQFGSGGAKTGPAPHVHPTPGAAPAPAQPPSQPAQTATPQTAKPAKKTKFASLRGKLSSALKGLDEISHNGVSMILGGVKNRSAQMIASGITHIIGCVFENVHQEVYEAALGEASKIPGAHAVGKIAADLATKATNLFLDGVTIALKKMTHQRAVTPGQAKAVLVMVRKAVLYGRRGGFRTQSEKAILRRIVRKGNTLVERLKAGQERRPLHRPMPQASPAPQAAPTQPAVPPAQPSPPPGQPAPAPVAASQPAQAPHPWPDLAESAARVRQEHEQELSRGRQQRRPDDDDMIDLGAPEEPEEPEHHAESDSEKEETDDSLVPKWDGEIDRHAVDPIRGSRGREHLTTWHYYDDDGTHYPNDISLRHGTYDAPDGTTVEVARWESSQDGQVGDHGEWTTDVDQAAVDGSDYATANDMEAPEEEEEPEEEEDLFGHKEEIQQLHNKGKQHIAAMLGMPEGAKVKRRKVGYDHQEGAWGFNLEVDHPEFNICYRFVGIDGEGKKYIHAIELRFKKKGGGLGTTIFSDMVREAATNGFSYIATHAAGNKDNPTYNGYYTWPTFGYNQDIDEFRYQYLEKIRSVFPDEKSVLDIMDNPDITAKLNEEDAQFIRDESAKIDAKLKRPLRDKTIISGKDWWLIHGSDMEHAKFDLSKGSRSREVLNDYLKSKGK